MSIKNYITNLRIQIRRQHARQRGCRSRDAPSLNPAPPGVVRIERPDPEIGGLDPDSHHADHESGRIREKHRRRPEWN
jgi:hypothetical protein